MKIRKVISVCAVVWASLPSSASPCSLAPVNRTIASDVRAAQVVVMAVPRETIGPYDAEHFVTFDILRTYKGVPRKQIEVRGYCAPAACEAACFRAGRPLVLFLRSVRAERESPRAYFELAMPYWGTSQVVGTHIQFATIPWSDARERINLRAEGVVLAGGEYDSYWGMPLEDFERAVLRAVASERAPPLTRSFHGGEPWPYRWH